MITKVLMPKSRDHPRKQVLEDCKKLIPGDELILVDDSKVIVEEHDVFRRMLKVF